MERVFADTGYWIALLKPPDELHEKASAASGDYTSNRIVTSEMVLNRLKAISAILSIVVKKLMLLVIAKP
jgi:hypothetical protein